MVGGDLHRFDRACTISPIDAFRQTRFRSVKHSRRALCIQITAGQAKRLLNQFLADADRLEIRSEQCGRAIYHWAR